MSFLFSPSVGDVREQPRTFAPVSYSVNNVKDASFVGGSIVSSDRATGVGKRKISDDEVES